MSMEGKGFRDILDNFDRFEYMKEYGDFLHTLQNIHDNCAYGWMDDKSRISEFDTSMKYFAEAQNLTVPTI